MHCILFQENYRLGGAFQWPPVSEVMEYRKQVFDTVLDVIENAPLDLPVTLDHPWVRSNRRPCHMMNLHYLLFVVVFDHGHWAWKVRIHSMCYLTIVQVGSDIPINFLIPENGGSKIFSDHLMSSSWSSVLEFTLRLHQFFSTSCPWACSEDLPHGSMHLHLWVSPGIATYQWTVE